MLEYGQGDAAEYNPIKNGPVAEQFTGEVSSRPVEEYTPAYSKCGRRSSGGLSVKLISALLVVGTGTASVAGVGSITGLPSGSGGQKEIISGYTEIYEPTGDSFSELTESEPGEYICYIELKEPYVETVEYGELPENEDNVGTIQLYSGEEKLEGRIAETHFFDGNRGISVYFIVSNDKAGSITAVFTYRHPDAGIVRLARKPDKSQ